MPFAGCGSKNALPMLNTHVFNFLIRELGFYKYETLSYSRINIEFLLNTERELHVNYEILYMEFTEKQHLREPASACSLGIVSGRGGSR